MRIAYDNYIDYVSSGSLVASSEQPECEIENVQNPRLAVKWCSDTASTQNVVINFLSASAYSITTAGILGHNITSGVSVLIEANASDSWGSPSFSTSFTVIEDGMLLKFFSSQEYQYWRFYFSGNGELEIGRLWLSNYVTINPSSLNDFTVTKNRNDTVTYSPYRQKFASPGVTWRSFKLDFPKTLSSVITNISTLFDTVGNYKSVIFCNFDTIRDFVLVEPVYCSINGNLDFKHVRNNAYEYSLELEEDL